MLLSCILDKPDPLNWPVTLNIYTLYIHTVHRQQFKGVDVQILIAVY